MGRLSGAGRFRWLRSLAQESGMDALSESLASELSLESEVALESELEMEGERGRFPPRAGSWSSTTEALERVMGGVCDVSTLEKE